MDPVAHTLVGATLAETGLRRTTPLATAALVLGANAPDIDILAAFGGPDAALYFRRGHTHGVLAMVLLPIVLTGSLMAWDRLVRRRQRPDAEPARAGALLGLGFLSVLTHPALDWLNTYGVRLLMPFDGAWFYGDALFIIDPWLWLLTAAAVVLARNRGRLSAAAFIVLGCAATALVTLTGMVPVGARIAWGVGIAAIAGLRMSSWAARRVPHLARACTIALLLYIGAMVSASQVARVQAMAWLGAQGIAVDQAAAGPTPADPLTWTVIAREADTYHFVARSWLAQPGLRFSREPLAVGPRNAVTRAALAAPQVRGLRTWLRFPSIEVQQSEHGYVVTIRDVRYARAAGGGLGTAVVRLDRSLRPL